MKDIFISYDSHDREWVENEFLPALRQANLSFYYDINGIDYGTSIYLWLDCALHDCKSFFMIISRSYISNTRYARWERDQIITRSIGKSLRVVPVFIDRDVSSHDLPIGVISLRGMRGYDPQILRGELQEFYNQMNGGRPFFPEDGRPANLPDIGFSTERRIRIQVSNTCSKGCSYCHWDEFLKIPVTANPDRLLAMMAGLRQAKRSLQNYTPRPKIEFTLTGGEPLEDGNFLKFLGSDAKDTYLVTNGMKLDRGIVSAIAQSGLGHVRVSLHPKDSSVPLETELVNIFNNVKFLLGCSQNIQVRFNYVVGTSGHSLMDFVTSIGSFFREYIPNKVMGIAFIQQSGTNFDDYLRIVDPIFHRAIQNWSPEQRVTFEDFAGGLRIELVRLNCDMRGDLIKRCFLCVKEKDISFGIDGRVRVCSGWDWDMRPKFKFAHINQDSPLRGISNIIRKNYGVAGFYGHFPFLIRKLKGVKVDDFFNRTLEKFDIGVKLAHLANDQHLGHNRRELLRSLAGIILKGQSPFQRLYEEGSYDETILNRTIEMCEVLLRWSFSVAKTEMTMDERIDMNVMMLLLAYHCVDENLFSTGRTILVRGLVADLLDWFVYEYHLTENENVRSEFHQATSYCIGTLIFEDIETNELKEYLGNMIPPDQPRLFMVCYLEGSIFRQLNEKTRAESSFKEAFHLSHEFLSKGLIRPHHKRLAQEIRADSQRSLAALLKNDPSREIESKEAFALADYFSSVDSTELRFMALFSDGYSALLRFFREDFNTWSGPIPSQHGRTAYLLLKNSIGINAGFYASLIRIALLDLAFETPEIAKRHASLADSLFSQRGLLTDQEYLNSQLCLFVALTADYCLNPSSPPYIPQAYFSGIAECKNIGPRDKRCVQEDFEILKIIILKVFAGRIDAWVRKLISNIDEFIALLN